MKTLSLVVAIFTLVAMFSLVVCGLWMKAQPQVDPSSIVFHTRLGIATAIGTALTAILLLMATRQMG